MDTDTPNADTLRGPFYRKSWTEADVNGFIGQAESMRLEFKAGVMFDRDQESKWIAELSKQVSAFANTEGGELVLGVEEEKKAGARVASAVDGVPATLASERLQQLIEAHVSPHLPGIRFHRVPLTTPLHRAVFIVQVPPGSTAYQAKDGLYYGRSEFEVKYLHDHEIRLRMNRGKIARAVVMSRPKRVVLGVGREEDLRRKHSAAIEAFKEDPADAFNRFPELFDLIGAGDLPDEISFTFFLCNDGELTLREPAVELRDAKPPGLFDGLVVQGDRLPSRLEMRGEVIYPGDEREISDSCRQVQCRRGVSLTDGGYVVKWKVFLDNSPPCAGEIDLGVLIQDARDAAASAKKDHSDRLGKQPQ